MLLAKNLAHVPSAVLDQISGILTLDMIPPREFSSLQFSGLLTWWLSVQSSFLDQLARTGRLQSSFDYFKRLRIVTPRLSKFSSPSTDQIVAGSSLSAPPSQSLPLLVLLLPLEHGVVFFHVEDVPFGTSFPT